MVEDGDNDSGVNVAPTSVRSEITTAKETIPKSASLKCSVLTCL